MEINLSFHSACSLRRTTSLPVELELVEDVVELVADAEEATEADSAAGGAVEEIAAADSEADVEASVGAAALEDADHRAVDAEADRDSAAERRWSWSRIACRASSS